MVNNQKKNRVLDIFYRAFKGEELSVSNLASEYEVSTKSITRDINEIKNFLADNRDVVGNSELLYSYQSKTYSLKFNHFLVSKELVAIVKILVGCRALSKEELLELIAKLKNLTDLQDCKLLEQVFAMKCIITMKYIMIVYANYLERKARNEGINQGISQVIK